MEPTLYVYQKERRQFGKPCNFTDKTQVIFSEPSNHELYEKDYILRDPVSRSTEYNVQFAHSEINTERATYENRGVLHTEGGWPKDICMKDQEQTTRYKRKIEKDESFISQVMGLTKPIEHTIFQNNAVNIYETYFDDMEDAPLLEPCSSRTLSVYKDPSGQKRPVTHLSWSPDGGTKIAVSHCAPLYNYQVPANLLMHSYIWETENPNSPLLILEPPSPIICLEYNQRDPTSLISGMYSGQVAAFDTRSGKDAAAITEREISHRESVNSVLWINSKSGTEFFSGSSDGQVMWWDTRKLNEPLERLLMDPIKTDEQHLSRSYGVSVLEYETTMPTKFMCGTEMGMVFVCNRKGKTPIEKINTKIKCQLGPVYAIARNPSFLKNFLTVGDWTARIWSEDCRESSIIWTKHQSTMLTDGMWSPTKCSMFYVTRMDGVLDAWDLLQQHNEPVHSMKVCDDPLLCLRGHETGKFITTGNKVGVTHLIEVSDNMSVSAKNDKPLLTAMFERENKREKILEAKMRELKLRVKTAQMIHEETEETKLAKLSVIAAACAQAEQDFMKCVEKERKRLAPRSAKKRNVDEEAGEIEEEEDESLSI